MTPRQRQIVLVVVLFLALGLLVRWKSSNRVEEPAHPARPDVFAEAADVPKRKPPSRRPISIEDVPLLSVTSLETPAAGNAGAHRDLFRFYEKPAPPAPKPKPQPRIARAGEPGFVGPLPPPPPPPPPVPPPISFKYLGSMGPKENRIAVLQLGDKVLDVREGAVVDAWFIVRRINYESIDVGFVGFPSSETKRVGINP